jgi:hypothetical protein
VKYPKEKFKKVSAAIRRKIFNFTYSSQGDSSDEGETTAQLKEKFT